jgi:hypothetical protein
MIPRLFSLLALLGLFAGAALADSPADLKRRMADRLATIDDYKTRELAGENNRGLLEARSGAGTAEQRVIADENRDREAVYALIARQTGATAEQVGQKRAEDIAHQARPGVWLQDKSGKWYRK